MQYFYPTLVRQGLSNASFNKHNSINRNTHGRNLNFDIENREHTFSLLAMLSCWFPGAVTT